MSKPSTGEAVKPVRRVRAPAAMDGQGDLTQTRQDVTCVCGHTQRVFVWAWAGNGFYRCKGPGCGRRVRYM